MNKNSTRHVFRNLLKETAMWELAGDTFPIDTKEAFVKAAKAWLGDKSELSSKTIDSANWNEVYEYFKDRRK